MFSELKPYDEYREIGLPWLGAVPAHWSVRRAKNIVQPVDVRSAGGLEELLTVSSARGVVRRSSATVSMFQATSYVGHKLCWPGDLVINSLWAWGRGLGVSRYHGIVSTAYGVYRPRAGQPIDETYLDLLTRSDAFQWELQVRSRGVWKSRLQLTDDQFLDAPLTVPPAAEQAAIVKYLAHAHHRIDRAIGAKRKLISLLEEQKQAIINQAVTRGLDPTAPLKDSGDPWLGEIPESWDRVRLKSLISPITQGWSPQCDAQPPSSGEWGVLKTGCSNYGVFRPEQSKRLAEGLEPRPEHQVTQGDIVMSRASTTALVGSAALVEETPERLMLSDKTYRFRTVDPRVLSEFLVATLQTRSVRAQIESRASGASFSMQNISQDVVRGLVMGPDPGSWTRGVITQRSAA